MKHYYCNDCHGVTPERLMSCWSDVYLDLFTGRDAVEGGPECPCGSPDVVEARKCDDCGEFAALDDDGLCRECAGNQRAA